jgi:hypothetical protein
LYHICSRKLRMVSWASEHKPNVSIWS